MKDQMTKWVQIVLGCFLIGYALNQFFQFFPTSYGKMPESAQMFLDAVIYYLPFLYLFEIFIGLLLILNKWHSIILIMLFPLSVSFMIFNISNNDFGDMWPALFVALANVYLVYQNKEKYMPLFD